MGKTKIIETPVIVYDDFTGGPDRLRVEINLPLATRIMCLSEVVKGNHLYKVCEFSCLPETLVVDYDDTGGCFYRPPQTEDEEMKCLVECVTLDVMDTSFCWSGMIKHTDVHWTSESISLSELDELLTERPASEEEGQRDCDNCCKNDPDAMEDYHCLHCPGSQPGHGPMTT